MPASDHQADLILRHGAVYTVSASRSWAEAIAIRGGRLVFVGSATGVEEWIGPRTRVVDLGGRLVLPGFHDSHVHLADGGVESNECDLATDSTVQLIAEQVRRSVAEHAHESWIRGTGWQLPVFPSASPSRGLLDSIVPDRPALLYSADGHSAWVNSRALALAHITGETRDPANGRIERDPVTGEPNGTLREAAMELVSELLPARTVADYEYGIRRGLAEANQLGITSLQEVDVRDTMLAAYASLERQGLLTARVTAALHVTTGRDTSQVATLAILRDRYAGRRLHPTTAKIFADGVIETRTAALLAPYLDHGTDRGEPTWSAPALDGMVTALDRAGFQVHVHAIGDRAIRMALDAYQGARRANGVRDARHIIAHLQLIDPTDIPRFKALDVIADFQPLWAFPDRYITELTLPVLGPERSRWLYPIGSVVRTGAVIVGGSDWTVSSLNPLEAIQVGITRRDPEADSGNAWIPEELVDLPTMVAAYTINGAFANHEEQETGSLEVGKAADLIVLDRNIFRIPAAEIHRARVLLTLLEGVEVYRDSGFAA